MFSYPWAVLSIKQISTGHTVKSEGDKNQCRRSGNTHFHRWILSGAVGGGREDNVCRAKLFFSQTLPLSGYVPSVRYLCHPGSFLWPFTVLISSPPKCPISLQPFPDPQRCAFSQARDHFVSCSRGWITSGIIALTRITAKAAVILLPLWKPS